MIIWQKRKRWGRIAPSIKISKELMKRIDKHCKVLAFKFPAVITGRVDAIIRILIKYTIIVTFAFYRDIYSVSKDT